MKTDVIFSYGDSQIKYIITDKKEYSWIKAVYYACVNIISLDSIWHEL
jgi:hypothetical protein